MNDFFASLIRTYVPVIVSAVGAFFAARGVTLDPNTLVALTAALTGLFNATYYLAVRLLERFVSPKFGWLLGYARMPAYTVTPKPAQGE